MLRRFHPYYLFSLLALAVASSFFFRIDKTSFYHHYFRVIGDVEVRNSQAVPTDATFSLPGTRVFAFFQAPGLILGHMLAAASTPFVAMRPVQTKLLNAIPRLDLPQRAAFLFLYPALAP
jgi:hypothetical protein